MMKNKISIYEFKRVVIEGYEKIIDINNNLIVFNDYIIIGDNLKVVSLDSYAVEIIGNINEVKLNEV